MAAADSRDPHHRWSAEVARACLVRMIELTDRCKVWTVDRDDFSAYLRHGRQAVPCAFPDI